MHDNDLAVCPGDGELCLADCDEQCVDIGLLPDDDDLVAYLGWLLFAGGAFLTAVFAAVLLTGWLLLS